MRERNKPGRGKRRPATTDSDKAAELSTEGKAATKTQPAKEETESSKEIQATAIESKPASSGEGKEKALEKTPAAAAGKPSTAEPPSSPPPPQQKEPEKTGGGGCATTSISLLALLLSLGVGGAGYYGWQQIQAERQQTAQEIQQAVSSQVGAVGSSLQENQQRLASVEKEITALKSEIGALEKKQEELRSLQQDTVLQEMTALNEKIATINDTVEEARQRLAELQSQQETISSRVEEANAVLEKLASVNQAITTLGEEVAAAAKRQQELMAALEAARQQGQKELDSWKLAEAEYLLKIATRRLSLEHDVRGATAALEAADENLADTNDPRWLPVRKSIAEMVEKLGALPKPDIEGGALKLAALEKKVDELPLPQPERHLKSTALDTSELKQAENLESWGQKAWNAVSKLVVIRRGERPATNALLPPDQAVFLRQNLHLKLEGARYALLRNDPKLYKENLQTAREWIEAHFDTGAEATRAMLESLEKLQKMEFPQAFPDISAPLQQLRKLRSRKASITQAAPQPAPEQEPPEQSTEEPQPQPSQPGDDQQEATPADAETEGGSS